MSETTTTKKHVAELSEEEFLESLTGHEELAVKRVFGDTIGDLLIGARSMYLRGLVFVHERRGGADDTAAHTAALDLPVKRVLAYFPESEDGADLDAEEENPVTAEGKDDEQPGSGLTIARSSA